MTAGIYVIYGPGNRAYIGQSRNVEARFNWHRSDLAKKRHTNPHLQNAWKRYGPSAFRFALIAQCPKRQLRRTEIAYMKAYIKAGWLLYNCNKRDAVHLTRS